MLRHARALRGLGAVAIAGAAALSLVGAARAADPVPFPAGSSIDVVAASLPSPIPAADRLAASGPAASPQFLAASGPVAVANGIAASSRPIAVPSDSGLSGVVSPANAAVAPDALEEPER